MTWGKIRAAGTGGNLAKTLMMRRRLHKTDNITKTPDITCGQTKQNEKNIIQAEQEKKDHEIFQDHDYSQTTIPTITITDTITTPNKQQTNTITKTDNKDTPDNKHDTNTTNTNIDKQTPTTDSQQNVNDDLAWNSDSTTGYITDNIQNLDIDFNKTANKQHDQKKQKNSKKEQTVKLANETSNKQKTHIETTLATTTTTPETPTATTTTTATETPTATNNTKAAATTTHNVEIMRF